MRRTQLKSDARDAVLTEIRSLKNAMVADDTRPGDQVICERLDRILTMVERGGEEIEEEIEEESEIEIDDVDVDDPGAVAFGGGAGDAERWDVGERPAGATAGGAPAGTTSDGAVQTLDPMDPNRLPQ